MRVLIAHNFYQQSGGEDQSFAAEVAALRAAGHDVTDYSVHNDSIRDMRGVDVALRTLWNRDTYRELRALFRKTRPRVAHFNNTFPLISPSAYYAARDEGVPVVQSLRNYRLLCPNALFFRDGGVCEQCLGKSVPWPAVVHKCYRDSRAGSATVAAMLTTHRLARTYESMVDVYVALTEFARRKLIEGGLPAERIVVKPNFVHPEPVPGEGRGGYAVYVGRLSDEKGVGTLLKAWELPDPAARPAIPVRIIGDGPMRPEVDAAAARTPAIQPLGRLAPAQAYDVIGDAALLVLPSECYETFGRVVVEAYAKGTPVVVSDHGAMAELVNPGRTGLRFRPSDPADLARRVNELTSDPAALARMRLEARREFDAKYTAERNVAQLLSIYETARESHARRHAATAETARAPSFRPVAT